MAKKDVTFEAIMELAGKLGVIKNMGPGHIYQFITKISDPESAGAQEIYKKLLDIQNKHENIDRNFVKIMKKNKSDYESGFSKIANKGEKQRINKKRNEEINESEKIAEEIIQSI